MLAEYQKAPQVTRDRMYLDTMAQIYTNVTKVVVDSKQGSNLLYLPLDKVMQLAAASDTSVLPSGSVSVTPSPQSPAWRRPFPTMRARATGPAPVTAKHARSLLP